MPKPKQITARKKNQITPSESKEPRRLYLPKRVWYKPFTWRFAPPVPNYKPLPKARMLFARVLRQLWHDKKLFGGIVTIYGLLNLLLVRSIAGSSDLTSLKDMLDSVLHGFGGKILSSLASFGYLLATSASGSAQSSATYQYILVIICSLAFIWALRQTLAKNTVRIRDAFYAGMYPLVPFLLVAFIIGIQLLPMVGAGTLYSLAVSNSVAIGFWEKALFFIFFLLMAFWSLRMITSSLFAAYIVTLPNMTPIRAIREAKQLVYGRRLLLWRKLIFLPISLLLLSALLVLPFILFVTSLAPWLFFVISTVTLPIVHGYLYNLYREML